MIVKILGGLDQSVEDSEMIGIHIENASNHTIEIRDRLWVIFYQKKVVDRTYVCTSLVCTFNQK